jgi:NAD(P)-dependent dehydrogenase (short-subunit alcohol dehydrogenase family)
MRGASVAILDVVEPGKEIGEGGAGEVKFYHCDVGDAAAVERVKRAIEDDVGRYAMNLHSFIHKLMSLVCVAGYTHHPPKQRRNRER